MAGPLWVSQAGEDLAGDARAKENGVDEGGLNDHGGEKNSF